MCLSECLAWTMDQKNVKKARQAINISFYMQTQNFPKHSFSVAAVVVLIRKYFDEIWKLRISMLFVLGVGHDNTV